MRQNGGAFRAFAVPSTNDGASRERSPAVPVLFWVCFADGSPQRAHASLAAVLLHECPRIVTWRPARILPAILLLFSVHSVACAQQEERSPRPDVPSPASTTRDSANRPPSHQRSRLPRTRLGVWAAGSMGSGSVLGTLQDGWLGLVALRYHRLLIPAGRNSRTSHEGATLTYTADVVPLAHVSIPKGTPPTARSLRIRSVTEQGFRAKGMGVYPLGVQVGFRSSHSLRPFVAGHTGLFYLFDAMPDERGRRLNFAAGVGLGTEITLSRRTHLTLGYRYHHLSNGFRGRINPGLDAHLLYVGVGLAR